MPTYEGDGALTAGNRAASVNLTGRTAWTITPDGGATVTLAINPNTVKMARNKRIAYQARNHQNKGVIFDQGNEKLSMSCSGTVVTQAAYEALLTLARTSVRCTLVDDLNRTFEVYITAFEPTRRRMGNAPWLHDYTLEMDILDLA